MNINFSYLRFNYYLHRGQLTHLVDPEKALSHVLNPYHRRKIETVKKTYIIACRETVARKVKEFINRVPIDELMTITPIYNFEKRKRSFELLKEVISE